MIRFLLQVKRDDIMEIRSKILCYHSIPKEINYDTNVTYF